MLLHQHPRSQHPHPLAEQLTGASAAVERLTRGAAIPGDLNISDAQRLMDYLESSLRRSTYLRG